MVSVQQVNRHLPNSTSERRDAEAAGLGQTDEQATEGCKANQRLYDKLDGDGTAIWTGTSFAGLMGTMCWDALEKEGG